MCPGEHSPRLPEPELGAPLAGAETAPAAMELHRERVAELVEAMVHRRGGLIPQVPSEAGWVQKGLHPTRPEPPVHRGHSARPRRRRERRRRHRGCGEKWRRGGVWRAVLGRRVRRMFPCCLIHHFSPLITAIRREHYQCEITLSIT